MQEAVICHVNFLVVATTFTVVKLLLNSAFFYRLSSRQFFRTFKAKRSIMIFDTVYVVKTYVTEFVATCLLV